MEVDARIKASLGRKLVVLGACSAPTPTPWGSTRSSTSRGSRGEGAGAPSRDAVVKPRLPGRHHDLVGPPRSRSGGCRPGQPVVTQKDAHLTNVRALSRAFDDRFEGPPGRCSSWAVRASTPRWGRARRRPGLRQGTTPGGGRVVPRARVLPARRDGNERAEPPAGASEQSALSAVSGPRSWHPALTSRHRTPTTAGSSSTARTSWPCSATSATEVCIRCDGDEGLFASYDRIDFLATGDRR